MDRIPPFILDLVIEDVIGKAEEVPIGNNQDVKGKEKRQLVAYRQHPDYENLILFIHGFTGSPTETFSNIPELLINEEKLNGFNILSLGYSSSLIPDLSSGFWSADPDLESLSTYFKTIFENQLNDYHQIAIVAHSMGGLVAQGGILKLDEESLKKISNFIMFGTPSGGIEIANSRLLRLLKKQSRNMGTKSDFIISLRKNWNRKFRHEYPFHFKTVAGLSDEFVKRESSLLQFEERYRFEIEGNHSSMVKADNDRDYNNQCFSLIVNDLSPYNTEVLQASPHALNTLLAKYRKTVNELSSDVNNLDARGLKKLILSLDGLGKEDLAIDILEKHRLTQENSDTMGILGGRYKRRYLFSSNSASDAEKALQCYNSGLKSSLENSNRHQVYYHAINLAFLSLVYRNDQTKMKEFAELALENCHENSVNVWELATIAEAYLYLNDLKNSEKFYGLIKQKTNDQIRIRSSIYINAKFAYTALVGYEE